MVATVIHAGRLWLGAGFIWHGMVGTIFWLMVGILFGRRMRLGIILGPGFRLVRIFRPFIARQGTDHHVDASADELGLEIRMAVRARFPRGISQ